MKHVLPLIAVAVALSGCQCQPGSPTSVTFRIKNPLGTPIFVDATDGRMGLDVKRHVLGAWLTSVDQPPACECLSCDQVCGGCECIPSVHGTVIKIDPGGTLERTWDGVLHIEGHGACGSAVVQGPACKTNENAPIDENLRVELCFAPSSNGADDAEAGTAVPGSLPDQSTSCIEKDFRIEDGLVEIAPARGAICSTHGDCKGNGELCLGGSCTSACPATGYPELGTGWQVLVNEPTDMGFFTIHETSDAVIYEGTGAIGSVRYDNDTMRLQLTRPVPGAPDKLYTASVDVILPSEAAVPLQQGETVTVKVIDAAEAMAGNRAITVRDRGGTLLLAADSALQEPLLAGADLAPFTLSAGTEILGCHNTDCGKSLYFKTKFSAGIDEVQLEPGARADFTVGDQSYRLVNLSNSQNPSDTWCTLKGMMPYVISNARAMP